MFPPVKNDGLSFGQRAILHASAFGKALLAYSPGKIIEDICSKRGLKPLTENTITGKEGLKTELKKVRQCGYVIDNKESHDYNRCLTAPMKDCRGEVI